MSFLKVGTGTPIVVTSTATATSEWGVKFKDWRCMTHDVSPAFQIEASPRPGSREDLAADFLTRWSEQISAVSLKGMQTQRQTKEPINVELRVG